MSCPPARPPAPRVSALRWAIKERGAILIEYYTREREAIAYFCPTAVGARGGRECCCRWCRPRARACVCALANFGLTCSRAPAAAHRACLSGARRLSAPPPSGACVSRRRVGSDRSVLSAHARAEGLRHLSAVIDLDPTPSPSPFYPTRVRAFGSKPPPPPPSLSLPCALFGFFSVPLIRTYARTRGPEEFRHPPATESKDPERRRGPKAFGCSGVRVGAAGRACVGR